MIACPFVRIPYILAALVAPLISGCAMLGDYSPLAPLERRMLFLPAKYPAGDWQPTTVVYEDVHFQAADGVKLHGWYVPHENPRGHAVFFHGNGGNVTLFADSLRILNRRHGLAVLVFDYRGYGKSEGKPSEKGILLDARAARDWLAEREGILPSDVVLMGLSLGGGVAVDLAASDGARGLVLVSTFTSLPDAAAAHLSWLPVRALMTMRLNSLEKIKDYHGPLLLSHGDEDQVVPYEQGVALYNAAPGPKRMITVKGGQHAMEQPEEYRVAFDEFIAGLPPLGSSRRMADVDISVEPLP
jgi:fermentation-respiration switch protein FrsA (DUF1100 family)